MGDNETENDYCLTIFTTYPLHHICLSNHIILSSPIKLLQSYRPAITFVIVRKRHHTRIFPAAGGQTDRSGNILPGTLSPNTCEFSTT